MSLLLRATDLRAAFGAQELFHIEQLELRDGDRIALVGANGAGKTTLLRALAGDEIDNAGLIERYGALHYLPQLENAREEASAAQLSRWGVRDIPKDDAASGGERARRKLASAFSARASVLLLDEPTANLDTTGAQWLEKTLAGFRGALVVVSHDRALMDAVCNTVWELENGALRAYPGNYSDYWRQREHLKETAWREYRAYREETARLTAAARDKAQSAAGVKKAPSRMGNSEARLHRRGAYLEVQEKLSKQSKAIQSRLEHMEKVDRPAIEPDLKAAMQPSGPIVSRTAAYVSSLTVRFGNRTVLDDAEASLPSGRRTVIMGPNGSGKTTLLRALLSEEGHLANGVKVALFDQTHAQLDPSRDLLGNVMARSIRPEWAARAVLARLGLNARDVAKPISALSGGERAKALLARLLVSDANFLVMDEPTNYLDLYAMSALEEMLVNYEGTLLLVTHDRALCDAVADRLLWVENAKVTAFNGGYSAFQAARSAPAASESERAMRADLLRMRMAQLGPKIDQAGGDEKQALENEYMNMARELKGIG